MMFSSSLARVRRRASNILDRAGWTKTTGRAPDGDRTPITSAIFFLGLRRVCRAAAVCTRYAAVAARGDGDRKLYGFAGLFIEVTAFLAARPQRGVAPLTISGV